MLLIGDGAVLGLITARGGSKGFPGKNLALLDGRSLIAWTAEAALGSRLLDRVVISTDDAAIKEAAVAAGCDAPFTRPAELAGDAASHVDVVRHALATLPDRYQYFVLLQPTSPLRTAEDIDACVELCARTGGPSVVSVTLFDKSLGTVVTLDPDNHVQRLVGLAAPEARRQDDRKFILNGAVYVCRCDSWHQNPRFVAQGTVAYVMPADRSIDIDSELDLLHAEAIVGRNKRLDARG